MQMKPRTWIPGMTLAVLLALRRLARLWWLGQRHTRADNGKAEKKRRRTNVHPGDTERAVSVRRHSHTARSRRSKPSGKAAVATSRRRISYFQWRRHRDRHRDGQHQRCERGE